MSSKVGNKGIVTDGLILHLDAGNPRSYPGFGTTWYDLSTKTSIGDYYITHVTTGVSYKASEYDELVGYLNSTLGPYNGVLTGTDVGDATWIPHRIGTDNPGMMTFEGDSVTSDTHHEVLIKEFGRKDGTQDDLPPNQNSNLQGWRPAYWPITYVLWVRSRESPSSGNSRIFMMQGLWDDNDSFGDTRVYFGHDGAGTDSTQYWSVGLQDTSFANHSETYIDNNWHMHTIIFDAQAFITHHSQSKLYWYIDDEVNKGISEISYNDTSSTHDNFQFNRYLGLGSTYPGAQGVDANYFSWVGDIAVVKIYDRVLTQTEILQNYNTLKRRFQ